MHLNPAFYSAHALSHLTCTHSWNHRFPTSRPRNDFRIAAMNFRMLHFPVSNYRLERTCVNDASLVKAQEADSTSVRSVRILARLLSCDCFCKHAVNANKLILHLLQSKLQESRAGFFVIFPLCVTSETTPPKLKMHKRYVLSKERDGDSKAE